MNKLLTLVKNKQRILGDILLNVISSLILVGLIQIIIFPLLARKEGSANFGEIAAIYGINNVISIALGNTLNNIRLLNTKKKGFQLIALIISIFSFLISFFLYLFYGKTQGINTILLMSLFTGLINYRTYACVKYRLDLQYVKRLIMNLYVSLGYVVGLAIYFNLNNWPIIFLAGELFGYAYLMKSTNIFSERIVIGNDFWLIIKEFKNLSLANTVSSTLTYLDRFLILPLLGSRYMTTFFSTSIASKIFNLVISPVTNVVLSYLTRSSKKISKLRLLQINLILLVLFVPLLAVLKVLTSVLVKLLYPSVYLDAKPLILLISIGVLANLMFSIINPIFLRFFTMRIQLILQFSFGICYLFLAVILAKKFGLYGFCLAFAIAYIMKWGLQIFIGCFAKYK